MKTQKTPDLGPVIRILCWFFAIWMALPASMVAQVVTLSPLTFPSSNTVRISVATGPVTNIRYNVYWTNSVASNATSWPLLATGAANQVIFDLALPDTNLGFFIVSSNFIATTNPPPKVATPVLSPPSTNGNASVLVTVTCDTPGAVIYYTTNNATPTTSDNYIANGAKLLISCLTTAKARAFRTDFIDSDVVTGIYNVNCPPTVSAGTQQTTSGTQITLAGTSSDDGLTQALSNYWRQVSGPATVTFGNVNSLTSTVDLPIAGIYVLQLEAFDGYWTSTSRVTVARSPAITIAVTRPVGSSTFNVPTNIALEASTNGSSFGAGLSVTQVQFYAGAQLIGKATNAGGANAQWAFEWRNVPAGNHSLTAVATSSDTSYLALASSPINITVNFPADIGRFTFAVNDLSIPVAGLPITINRIYDPRFGTNSGSVGHNGRLDYESVRIQKSALLSVGYTALNTGGKDCIIPGDGRALITISLSPTEQYYFRPRVVFQAGAAPCVGQGSATFLSDIRYVFDTVGTAGGALAFINAPGTVGMVSDESEFGGWGGNATPCTHDGAGACDSSYEPDWTLFAFTAPDGTQYKFDTNGKLLQRIDRNNNSLTYGNTNITHGSGKGVDFVRTSGRITAIRDSIAIASAGPAAIKYSYDAGGQMTNVARLVDRGGAGTYDNTAYRYEDPTLTNSITRVIDPRGITVISNSFDGSGRLSRQYDAFGNYTSFAYEDNGRRQVVTDKNGKTTRQNLTEAGQVASAQNAEGAVTSYGYDSNGRRIAEITPVGATNTFGYNDRNELVAATNELSFSASATYNSFGLPLTFVDPAGFGATNGYDTKGNLLAITNALGVMTRYGYDSQGNRTAETNAFGLSEQTVTLSQYDSFGYITNVIDALSNTTAYAYDANGNILTQRRDRTLAGGSKQTLLTSNIYDAANRAIGVIEPDGFTNRVVFNGIGKTAHTTNKQGVVTRFDYDARGSLTNTVFALGTGVQASEQNAYDPEGRRTNSVDRAGRTTTFTYDGVGRLKRTTFIDGSYTESQYDAAGRIFATVQGPRPPGGINFPPENLTTRYEYDVAGRRVALVNALGQTNRFSYDANGNQTKFVDALNHTNSYTYDRVNQQIAVTFADQTTNGFTYNALRRRTSVSDQTGITTRFAYDPVGRLIAVTNAFGTGTSTWETYAYDEAGNQTNQVDALGRMTRFEYDALARRTKTVLAGSQSELIAYDALGNPTLQTNFNGVVLTNQYDALNRLTNRASAGSYTVAFSYTATGQRATMSDPSGTTIYAYDTRDRLITNSAPQGTLVYSYDLFGNLQTLASTRSGGANVTYSYDLLNRVTNASGNSASAIYGFDAVGNLQTARLGNGVTNTYTYDGLNRLTNILAKSSSGTLATFAYRVASTGNRTNLVETVNGTSRTNQWRYDNLYRLTNETIVGLGAITNGYDVVGNRTNRASSVSGVTNQTFTFNTNDWLSTEVYDSNGNTRTNGSNVYAYDVENRLTNYNSGSAIFVYNGDGWLVRKIVGGTTTLYLVDDRNPTGYAQAVEEATVTGGGTNLAAVYVLGLDLIAQNRGGTVSYYGYDGNGNTRYLSGSGGTVTDTYLYDAFGIQLSATGSTTNEFRYSGERLVPELGFYFLRARYLNPDIGRFITRDSFAGVQNDPISLHKYLYAHNNPINGNDPSGHEFNIISTVSALGIGLYVQTTIFLATAGVYAEAAAILTAVTFFRAAQILTTGVDPDTGEAATAIATAFAVIDVLPAGRTITTPIRGRAADIWRDAARGIWDRFSKIARQGGDVDRVHHRIPLEWSHLFPTSNPNRIGNLKLVPKAIHDDAGGVNSAWTQFRNSLGGRTPTQQEILDKAAEIDTQFGQYFKSLE